MDAGHVEVKVSVVVDLTFWGALKLRLMGKEAALMLVREHVKILREQLIKNGRLDPGVIP